MNTLNLKTDTKKRTQIEPSPLLVEEQRRRFDNSSEKVLSTSLSNPFSHLYIAILITLHRQILAQVAIELADEQAMIEQLTKLIKHRGIFKLDEIYALTDGFQLDKLQALLDRHYKLECDQQHQYATNNVGKNTHSSLKTLSAILKQKHSMLNLQDGLSVLA